MSFRRLQVNLPQEILSEIKKRAFSEGISESKIAWKLIEIGLTAQPGSSELAVLGGGAGMDLEMLKKAIGEERDEHEKTRSELAAMGLLPDPPNGSGLSPQMIKFQVETLTKTYELLRKVSLHLSQENTKEHEDRLKYAEAMAMEIVKNLNLGDEK
ncbi:MAG: hypothetical protein M0041_04540 [Nitrospiraceae bacterium]|nr:hypothetical protein [Nitrospiraceae bacterium]